MEGYISKKLEGATFPSMEAAFAHMKIEALKQGFDIGSTESLRSTYGKFYCLKGGRQRGDHTAKTGCQWSICLVPTRDSADPGSVRCTRLNLEHNHPLRPDIFSFFTCPEDVQDLIRKMSSVDISTRKIRRFMQLLDHELTSLQIRKIIGRQTNCYADAESIELEKYVKEHDGLFYRLEKSDGSQRFCQAVLSIMPFERENLIKFGSVLFIDGTQNNSRLKWEMIPLTVIDQYRRIRSAGLCMTASGDEEALTWLLSQLMKEKAIRDKIKSVITDEDSAFGPAWHNIQSTFDTSAGHVICAFHKERNFVRKLKKCGFTKLQVQIAKDLFKIVCYSPNKQAVVRASEEIQEMSERLCQYWKKNIEPHMPQFSRAFIESYTKGYNTTSPAESHNNMVKRDINTRRDLSLTQIRIDYTRAHVDAEQAFEERMVHSFTNHHFTWTDGRVMLSPKIRRQIDISIEEMEKLVAVPFDNQRMKMFMPDANELSYICGKDSCECRKFEFEGLPCSHILRYRKECGYGFPYELISRDWIILSPDEVVTPLDIDGQLSDTEHSDCMDPASSEVELIVDGDEMELPDNEKGLDINDIVRMITNIDEYKEQRSRYLRLFHLAKSVVSLASRSADLSRELLLKLNELKGHLLQIPTDILLTKEFEKNSDDDQDRAEEEIQASDNNPNQVPVTDVSGRRRGRRRNAEKEKESCLLCGKMHKITSCNKYKEFLAAIEHNKSIEGSGRRCTVCAGLRHNARTCPWVFRPAKQ